MSIRTGAVAVSLAVLTLLNAGCAVNSHQPVAVNRHQPVAVAHVDDHAITMTIQVNFSQNNLLAQSNITVESLYGVVLLSGMVKTQVEKTTAQNIAENVDGVKTVHNAIELQPITSEDWQPRRTDRQVLSFRPDNNSPINQAFIENNY
jgi:osmotically-inducible protein OsmY